MQSRGVTKEFKEGGPQAPPRGDFFLGRGPSFDKLRVTFR